MLFIVYLFNFTKQSDNLANCSNVSASPLIFNGSPHSVIAASTSSLEYGSSCEFLRLFDNVFLL